MAELIIPGIKGGLRVRAANLETDELLIEDDDNYAVVGVLQYVDVLWNKLPDFAKHSDGAYALFDWKGREYRVPLASNVGETLPLDVREEPVGGTALH